MASISAVGTAGGTAGTTTGAAACGAVGAAVVATGAAGGSSDKQFPLPDASLHLVRCVGRAISETDVQPSIGRIDSGK